MNCQNLPQGSEIDSAGVRYRVWAPVCRGIEVEIQSAEGGILRRVPLPRSGAGIFAALDEAGRAGDLYKFHVDGRASYPDPASRWQPQGVHGPSMVIDPAAYLWHDQAWRCPGFRDLVIYELHVGAFTPEGTFRAAIERLPYLRDLGINALEIMPVADFAGERGWGYDGVCLYAPARIYGHPDDFRALVDAAHAVGIAVILDVVYNHFGPAGNYLFAYIGDYLDESKKTPWGGAIRYGSPVFQPLRAFVAANPGYWMREFHIDGFRLDATHAILDESPRHILQELTAAIHAQGGFALAEDSRNDSCVLLPEDSGGLGFDGVWADDFHHTVRVAQTGENESYLGDFTGSARELVDALRHGWLYRGQTSPAKGRRRGTECRHLSIEKFIHCISNHDQIGNRAFGDRLNQVISREAYLACSALLCLTPYSPLLFMGQEWAASTPFLFFTDHDPELGALITKGRREEFKAFKAFARPDVLQSIPDPQQRVTFEASKLQWDEPASATNAPVLELYRACLALRNTEPAFRPRSRDAFQVEALHLEAAAVRLKGPEGDWLILCDLTGGHEGSLQDDLICRPQPAHAWKTVLSTSEKRFGGPGKPAVDLEHHCAAFTAPEVVVLREHRRS